MDGVGHWWLLVNRHMKLIHFAHPLDLALEI